MGETRWVGLGRQASAALSALLILGGAAGVLAGALEPWAHVTLFHNIALHLSGLLFTQGSLCLSAALLILLGMRRSPLLCAIAALFVLHWAGQARTEIPHRVKHQVIGAQLALFPLNRLLDQFHIDDVQVGDYQTPDAQLLAGGLDTTVKAGALLLLGSLFGLPIDPAIVWVTARVVQTRCRACGARWIQSRAVVFCPQCATPTSDLSTRRCSACGTNTKPSDHFCVACGLGLT
jgi:hypothetical protein